MRILTDAQEAILKEERRYLSALQSELERFGISEEDRETLKRSIRQVDELFLLVVVGEFNSGKSTFINALLGQHYLEEGVTPTTTLVTVLRYGETVGQSLLDEHTLLFTAPAEFLADISVVDTPGTNAVIREHEAITAGFVPRADLVLFVTSADRPYTESERAFLEKIKEWGKKLLVVINKCDIFEDESKLDEVVGYVSAQLKGTLGLTPPVFPVSARLALQARTGRPENWAAARFEALETHIKESLDARSRLQLKFLNPLGVGLRLVDGYLERATERAGVLDRDGETLSEVERQLEVYRADMDDDFKYRLTDVENILLEMEQRGQTFFDETLQLMRLFDLMDKNYIQRQFERKVVADVPDQIEQKVNELIDWLVDRDFRQWEAVTNHLAERRQLHKGHILDDASHTGFQYDRQRLIEAVGSEAARVVESYDRSREASKMAAETQAAVAATAVLEAGAVGLGALIAALTTTVAVDVTGILLASALAVLGLFIIPARRKQARKDMSIKVAALREQLVATLSQTFETEIEAGLARIGGAINPYSRFVRVERDKVDEARRGLREIKTRLLDLQGQVERLLQL
jgi:small GTP-binding protein